MTINVVPTEKTKSNSMTVVFEIITVMLLNASFLFCFYTATAITLHWSLIVIAIIAPALMYVLCSNKTLGRYAMFYLVLILVLAIIITYSYSSKSFALLFNSIIEPINKNGIIIVPFSVSVALEKVSNHIYFALLVLVLFSSMLVADGIKNLHIFLTTIILFIPIVGGIIFKLNPSFLSLLVFLIIYIVFLYLCVTKKKELHVSVNVIILQLVSCIIFCVAAIALSVMSINSVKPIEKLRNNIIASVNDYRYSSKSDLTVQRLPNGDLTQAGTLSFTGNPVFNIEVDNPSQLYLRSFIGENFSDGKWHTLQNPYTGNFFGMMEYFDLNKFYPLLQLSNYYKVEESRTGTTTRYGEITIKNLLEDSNMIYTTYETAFDDNISNNKILENSILANGLHGQREYVINAYTPIFNDYAKGDLDSWVKSINKKADLSKYSQLESIYRSFVYSNYLNVDSKYKTVVDELDIGKIENEKYSDLIFELRQKFQELFTYSEEVEVAKNNDPLINFVTNTRKGYDCYFATLATLALRNEGIPARYAEGYFIPASDMEMYKTINNIEFDVCDTAEHAWVEVYVDSVGWIPVEVTPGYYSLDQEDSNTVSNEEEITPNNEDEYYYDEDESSSVQEESPNVNSTRTGVMIIVVFACITLVVIITIIIRHFTIIKHIKRAETYKDTIDGYKLFIKRVKRKKCNLDTLEVNSYLELVYKERYSKEGLSKEERKKASEYVLKLLKQRDK